MTKILIISSSPRDKSVSTRIATHLYNRIQNIEALEVQLMDIRDHLVPHVQDVWKEREDVPEKYKVLYDDVANADGYIIVSPEYNGSFTPALKNLLDHFYISHYTKKPFGIVTGSIGSQGGMRAAQKLLHLVPALFGYASPFMLVVPQMNKKFDEEGKLLVEDFQKSIDRFVEEYLWLVDRLQKMAGQLIE